MIARVAASPARSVGEIELGGLENVLGVHLGIAYGSLVADLEPKLLGLGLTPKQAAILWLVDANPGITQAALHRFFRVERTTINVMAKSLARKGLLKMRATCCDKRKLELVITRNGNAALKAARQIIEGHEASFFPDMEHGVREALTSWLRAVARFSGNRY